MVVMTVTMATNVRRIVVRVVWVPSVIHSMANAQKVVFQDIMVFFVNIFAAITVRIPHVIKIPEDAYWDVRMECAVQTAMKFVQREHLEKIVLQLAHYVGTTCVMQKQEHVVLAALLVILDHYVKMLFHYMAPVTTISPKMIPSLYPVVFLRLCW